MGWGYNIVELSFPIVDYMHELTPTLFQIVFQVT